MSFLGTMLLFSAQAQAQAQGLSFSPLVSRGTDSHSMAFTDSGDLYFLGWDGGLEMVSAADLPDTPDGLAQRLIPMADYLVLFGPSDDVTEVLDVNSVGLAFDALGRVFSYVVVMGRTSTGTEVARLGFARCNADGTDLTPVPLVSGVDIPGLVSVGDDFGLIPPATGFGPLQMALTTLGGEEVLLFTVYDVPGILMAPLAGGEVTYLRQLSPSALTIWTFTLMERSGQRSLVYSSSDCNIYAFDLDDPLAEPVLLASNDDFVTFFVERFPGDITMDNDARHIEMVYEPVGDKLYLVVNIWHASTPDTIFSLNPDGSALSRLVDGLEMVGLLDFRTLSMGVAYCFAAMTISPVAVAQGQQSLFLGDYWSGLMMIRMDMVEDHALVEDTCEVGGGGKDIDTLEASFDAEAGQIVVEMTLCGEPHRKIKYRVGLDYREPFIGDLCCCWSTADSGMMLFKDRAHGPGTITVEGNKLIFRVDLGDLSPGLMGGGTVYIWANTQFRGVIDRAPNTDGTDGCAKPQVPEEALELSF